MKLFSIRKFADGTSLRSGLQITAEHFDYCFSRLKPGVYEVMRRRGIAEDTIVAVMGHKTRSMLTRYSIVNESDLRDEIRKLEAKITVDTQCGQSSNAETKQVQ